MAVRDVLLFGDPRLTAVADVVDPNRADWVTDANDLQETLTHLRKTLGFGRALAAPQIGSSFRMVAFECDLGSFVALNPRIVWASQECRPVWDDCFSLPGTSVAVTRSVSVTMEYSDREGRLQRLERLSPGHSELVQHEIDHLDGILMTQRMVAPGAIVASAMAGRTVHPATTRR
ncbi:peptide deformylase [Roseibium sp. Sym1]|uniref:peptide deformylase n=1 Tax=Roseibium sp. Sym1 TaxID=3016006 RepID=UPI0022B3F3B5|nr:peptide deformylase [Roseibium sp. Sym1]